MNRSVYFIVFVALVAIARSEANLDNNLGSSVQVVEDINEFISKNPEVILTPLEKQLGSSQHYSFGYRVSGDRIVAHGSNNFNYGEPQDVQQNLWYPSSGYGAIVSFVEIWVDQSSNIGHAYVVQGGIGQRQITIVIEARETTYFSYDAYVYGF